MNKIEYAKSHLGVPTRKISDFTVCRKITRGFRRIVLDPEAYNAHHRSLKEVWFSGRQWAVTPYGVERLDGSYSLEGRRLRESNFYPWPMHISNKMPDADIDDFTTAWMVGLVLHRKAENIDRVALLEMFKRLRPIKSAKDA